jgi:uncharacterized protein (TIGR00251 family)
MKIKIKLHPNSSKEEIKKISDGEYEIWIKEKPIDGKANFYLEKFLKKYFRKPVKIISGLTSRVKFVEI